MRLFNNKYIKHREFQTGNFRHRDIWFFGNTAKICTQNIRQKYQPAKLYFCFASGCPIILTGAVINCSLFLPNGRTIFVCYAKIFLRLSFEVRSHRPLLWHYRSGLCGFTSKNQPGPADFRNFNNLYTDMKLTGETIGFSNEEKHCTKTLNQTFLSNSFMKQTHL